MRKLLLFLVLLLFFIVPMSKADILCELPDLIEKQSFMPFVCYGFSNVNYSCVVNVYEDSRLVHVYPEIVEYRSGLLTVGNGRVEDRVSFVSDRGILNVYFGDRKLLTEQVYNVSLKCNNGTGFESFSNANVTLFYDTPSSIANRTVWAKNNVEYLFLWLIALIMIVLVIAWGFSQFKNSRTHR